MNIENEVIESLLKQIMVRFDKIDKTLEQIKRLKECLDGDTLLDNQDMCNLLNVTKRTIAEYRHKKLLRFYIIDRKCYYKASELREFLKQKGKKYEE